MEGDGRKSPNSRSIGLQLWTNDTQTAVEEVLIQETNCEGCCGPSMVSVGSKSATADSQPKSVCVTMMGHARRLVMQKEHGHIRLIWGEKSGLTRILDVAMQVLPGD